MQTGFICSNCGTQTDGEWGGSKILLVLLLFFYLIPGLLYWAYAEGLPRRCTCCGLKSLVPSSSPRGRTL